MGVDTKGCNRCGETKPAADFYWKKGKPEGWCKACYREWHRERYTPKRGMDDAPRPCANCGASYQPKARRASLYCSRECLAEQRKLSGKERDKHLQRRYGITAADYDRMLAEQGGGCALCGVTPDELTRGRYRTYLHVDHCHDTGRVRGLLCPTHNLLLGQWAHSPELLRRAVEYLEARASS